MVKTARILISLLPLFALLGTAPANADHSLVSQPQGKSAQGAQGLFKTAPELYRASVNDTLYLALPDGGVFQGKVRNIWPHDSANRTLILSSLDSLPTSRATLTVTPAGQIAGWISAGSSRYQLTPEGSKNKGSLVRVVNTNVGSLTNDVKENSRQTDNTFRQAKPNTAMPKSGAATPVLTLIMGYTPNLATKNPGDGLQAFFDGMEAYANQSYLDSDINLVLDLGATIQVDYDDTAGGQISDVLYLIMPTSEHYNPGKYAKIYNLIALQRADLFGIATTVEPDGFLGFSNNIYVPGDSTFSEFVMVDSGDIAHTFTHEIGHLLGGRHDLSQDASDGAFTYSHGFMTTNGNNTIMSISSGNKLPQFSNPLQTCPGGVPCGDAATADMTRTVNQTAPYIAVGGDVLSAVSFDKFAGPDDLPASASRGAGLRFSLDCALNPSNNEICGGSWTVELHQGASVVITYPDLFYRGVHTGFDVDAGHASFYTLYPGPDVAPGNYTIYLKSDAVSPDLDVQSPTISLTAPPPEASLLTVVDAGANYLTLSAQAHGNGTAGTGLFGAQVQGGGASFTGTDLALDWKVVAKTYTGTVTGLPCKTAFDADFTATSTQGADLAGPINASTTPCVAGSAPSGVSLSADPGVASSAFTVKATVPTATGEVHVNVMGGPEAQTSGSASELAAGVALSVQSLDCETDYQAQATVIAGEYAAVSNLASFTTGACDAGKAGFAAGSASGDEGSTVTLTVNRAEGANGAASVSYATLPGSADSADYTAVSGTLSWADGQSAAKTIQIVLSADSASEGDETFTVTLNNPQGMALEAGQDHATVTIHNKSSSGGGGGTTPPPSGNDGDGGGGSLGWLGLVTLLGLRYGSRSNSTASLSCKRLYR